MFAKHTKWYLMSKASATRLNILQAAFDLIYRKGFQATSIDDIIATTHVTKGAFFYHFKNKEEMGLSIINEIMYPSMIPFMLRFLERPGDVRKNIYEMMKSLLLKAPSFKVEFGCPAVNLIEEMAPLNETFRKALSQLVVRWQKAIEEALIKAQAAGDISAQHNPKAISMYITSTYGGIRNMGKVFGRGSYNQFLKEFKKYLDTLN
ncbi:TetR family transcriptional regulator [Arcticibacter tournemirensis]|nr:TetR/AcrR family transcriptional regulator [Arcticibacter tournemirensis]TQM51820.1 TetR family transcriptional regulator [Arcticibacter tournemirensis]